MSKMLEHVLEAFPIGREVEVTYKNDTIGVVTNGDNWELWLNDILLASSTNAVELLEVAVKEGENLHSILESEECFLIIF